jgi:hypothetical protein
MAPAAGAVRYLPGSAKAAAKAATPKAKAKPATKGKKKG